MTTDRENKKQHTHLKQDARIKSIYIFYQVHGEGLLWQIQYMINVLCLLNRPVTYMTKWENFRGKERQRKYDTHKTKIKIHISVQE